MEIEGFTVQEPDIHKAIDRVIEHYKNFSVADPELFLVFFSFDDIAVEMRSALSFAFPNSQFVGTSSVGGILTSSFENFDSACSVSVLAFYDHEGAYGVASNLMGANPADTITYTIDQAIISSGRQGEIPKLVWFYSEHMDESLAIQIMESKFGSSIPIFGGVPGHSTLATESFCQKFVYHNEQCFVVVLFYPSCEVVTNQTNFYYPLTKTGIISRISDHAIDEIDNTDARDVYLEWLRDYFPVELFDEVKDPDSTLFTNYPLGIKVGISSEGAIYRIYSILKYGPRGGLCMYNQLSVGDRIILMHSQDQDQILSKFQESFDKLISKCGQPLAMMSSMCCLLKSYFNDESWSFMSRYGFPNVGFFAEGEHGRLANGVNVSASLMLCTVAFCPRKEGI